MATFDVEGPCQGARVRFESDDQGILIDLVDQAGILSSVPAYCTLRLTSCAPYKLPIKPHVVPKKRVNFIYKTNESLNEMVSQLERLGMTFPNKESFDAFDIPHQDNPHVDVYYREEDKGSTRTHKDCSELRRASNGKRIVAPLRFRSGSHICSCGSPAEISFTFSFSK